MPSICHFEIPADNLERARNFYTDLFGWKIEKDANMDYWLISTGEPGKGAYGGMMMRQDPQQPILNYIDVPSVEEYIARVVKLGGKIIMPKSPVPGMGYFAVFLDTENNALAIWEEDKEAK